MNKRAIAKVLVANSSQETIPCYGGLSGESWQCSECPVNDYFPGIECTTENYALLSVRWLAEHPKKPKAHKQRELVKVLREAIKGSLLLLENNLPNSAGRALREALEATKEEAGD